MSKQNGPIRRWLNKLGLTSSSEEQIPTAELSKPDFETAPPESPPETQAGPEPELLTEQELEMTTADTKPLPAEMTAESFITEPEPEPEIITEPEKPAEFVNEPDMGAEMESKVTNTQDTVPEVTSRTSGPLLDLDDFEPVRSAREEDFILDLDMGDGSEMPSPAGSYSQQMTGAMTAPTAVAEYDLSHQQTANELAEPTVDPMAETQELIQPVMQESLQQQPERTFTEPQIVEGETMRMSRPVEGSQISLEQLSPEAIDAVARRAVEMLSERVVQEIAWEVVPQLAELMIKRQLEEKNT